MDRTIHSFPPKGTSVGTDSRTKGSQPVMVEEGWKERGASRSLPLVSQLPKGLY